MPQKKIDITEDSVSLGYRSGMLVVTRVFSFDYAPTILYVESLCECGGKRTVPLITFLRKETISCGCKDFFVNAMFRSYRMGSIKRSLSFKLTKIDFLNLIERNCHYCGVPPQKRTKTRNGNSISLSANGIDRVDNTEGYIVSNCVPCCWDCNRAKGNLTTEEFIFWLNRIHNFRAKNEDLNVDKCNEGATLTTHVNSRGCEKCV